MSSFYSTIWLAGIAIFSMFFGAGNVVFPLKVGLISGDQFPYAITGLLLTAIGGPILGLISATLFQGRCLEFFCRPGKKLGLILIVISLGLLGPFAVIPRCIVVAHSAVSSIAHIDLLSFSLFMGFCSFLCCMRESYILPILGRFFSPLLLISLLCVIAGGIYTGISLPEVEMSSKSAFVYGLEEGFDTMDLIASLFFSSSIWTLLLIKMKDDRMVAKTAVSAGLIGGTLLGLVYIGLGLATAYHAQDLQNLSPEMLMPSLSKLILGSLWGNIANFAIVIACFTTIVSLTQTIGSLLCKEFFPDKIRYSHSIITIILVSIVFSNLGFAILSSLIHPAITICYPAIIVLTICNLIHKLYGLEMIKRPVYGTLFSSTAIKTASLIGVI